MFHPTIDLYTNFAFTHPHKKIIQRCLKTSFLTSTNTTLNPQRTQTTKKSKNINEKKIIIKIFVFSSSQINYETNFVGIFLRYSIINTFG